MQNDDKPLPSIFIAGLGILVKMLIILEQHDTSTVYILIKLCILIHFIIFEIQVCKNGDWPCQENFMQQILVTILHSCVSIMSKCIRIRFCMEPISEQL